MLDRVVRYLRCPHCACTLTASRRTLFCPDGHSFDVARQGYVNLLPRPTKLTADTKDMVNARAAFLAAGHYAPIADALVELLRGTVDTSLSGCVVDVGGGTGYYHAAILDALPQAEGVLVDISKFAARHAVTAHERISAVVADTWQELPLHSEAATVVLNTFAPRNAPELHRILRRRGVLLVVTPRGDHLREIIGPLGLMRVEDRKEDRLAGQLEPYFTAVATDRLKATMALDHPALTQLVGMGPNAWHQNAHNLTKRISQLPRWSDVTLAVTVTAYRPLVSPSTTTRRRSTA
ncbi:MAG: 23S rRNA methyltransferase [Kutzneria sp.]|nr:23S rRNA methyltransferase [Kutzneria sp.]